MSKANPEAKETDTSASKLKPVVATSVFESAIIDADIDTVYKVIRPVKFEFASNVKETKTSDPDGLVGGIREITYTDSML